MLKKIPTEQTELGMYLHGMEGSWLSHPFWKSRFLLEDPADLQALKASGVPAVWIDISKGRDVVKGRRGAGAAGRRAATAAGRAGAARCRPRCQHAGTRLQPGRRA